VSISREVWFLAAKRTAFGAFGGALRGQSATELGILSARAALGEAGVTPADVEHVVMGNALQTSADAIYLARHVGLGAGLPVETPAVTVNRLCASGFQAVTQGAQEILLEDAEVVLSGGTESMSQAPHAIRGARWGDLRLGPAAGRFDDVLWQALLDSRCGLTMAETAERVAAKYAVTREESDRVALRSHQRAAAAWNEGRFEAEVVPVALRGRRGDTQFARDEHIRSDASYEALSGLAPYFSESGLVTAGSASGIGDGAASMVLASARWATERGLEPLGRIVSWAYVGVEPDLMGIGPAPAIRKALERAGKRLDEMRLVEVNEAFAPQYVAVERELGLDPEKTNVDGGAIALTHPLAASGARILVHLLHELRRRGGGFGVGSACVGGGQGGAVVVEAFGKS
jgi:acetyl-CoA acyltransferase 2